MTLVSTLCVVVCFFGIIYLACGGGPYAGWAFLAAYLIGIAIAASCVAYRLPTTWWQAAIAGALPPLLMWGIGDFMAANQKPSKQELRERSLLAIGIVGSGLGDLATNHDEYLAEAYGQ